jgi:UDP-N-acetylmuramoylalanine--D-glutamate ligase
MTLVEGFDDDAVALARLLAGEGRAVMLAAPGPASTAALALRELGVEVREHADLDSDPGEHDEAFLDVWTPEVSPRVARLRAGGCRVRCLADLVLERSAATTVGVTGTAGKTTTAFLLVQLLRAAGVDVHASTTARAGNLWPTGELLPVPTAGVVVVELTSSHLCFAAHSPSVATVACFWPDHLELHGSLDRYRAAKEAIVRGQRADDVVVANEDDDGAMAIAALSPGHRIGFSSAREVQEGAFLAGGSLVLRTGQGDRELPLPAGLDGPRRQALLAAVATAHAAGTVPTALDGLRLPALRSVVVGRRDGAELVDDGMAATPAKTAAALRERADRSVVLVAGGELTTAGLPVHATPEEQRLLEEACAEARRAARVVVLFGPAAVRAEPLLGSTPVARADDLAEAVALAGEHLAGADALLVSPMFPISLEAREQVAPALRALADRPGNNEAGSSV